MPSGLASHNALPLLPACQKMILTIVVGRRLVAELLAQDGKKPT